MGYMFSLYLTISLLLLAQLKEKRGKMLNVQLEMGFILWTYISGLAVVALHAAVRVNLRLSLT